MLTLGIETSGPAGTVALCRDGVCLEERPLPQAGRRHAQTLVAEIDSLLRKFGISARDVDVVAVSIGPGSFTGLRVGVVCAKTFAYATRCRLAAVETFQGIAENSPANVTDLFVAGDAQRGELYAGSYHREPDTVFTRQGEIAIVDGETWCRTRRSTDVVSGPGVEKFEPLLLRTCHVLGPEFRHPKAAAVARLGERKVRSGNFDDFWTLQPFYLRKSAAEEKWQSGSLLRW